MTLSQIARHISANVRTFGLHRSIQDAAYHATRKLIDVRVLKGMTVTLPDVNRSLLDSQGFTARFLSAADLSGALAEPEWRTSFSPAWINAVLSKGDECFGIFDGAVLASVGWYAATPTPVTDDLALHFDPAWVYMHRGYTARAYRGRRLHGVGMSLALREYATKGANGLISFVDLDNLRSLRSVERMGYRVFGSIWLTRANGRARCWSSPGCRRYQFRLVPCEGDVLRTQERRLV